MHWPDNNNNNNNNNNNTVNRDQPTSTSNGREEITRLFQSQRIKMNVGFSPVTPKHSALACSSARVHHDEPDQRPPSLESYGRQHSTFFIVAQLPQTVKQHTNTACYVVV
jgi:hypothetical protein